MTGILAVESATDACSVALLSAEGAMRARHEIAPRQHSALVFTMLEDLVPGGGLAQKGVEVVAYGSGPGSFTGLRVAASVAQGLAYSAGLAAVAVSTLATMAQTALRCGIVETADSVLCTLDARVNEVYAAIFAFRDGLAFQQGPVIACPPAAVSLEGNEPLIAIGNGCDYLSSFPDTERERIVSAHAELVPHAQDMLPLAMARYAAGDTLSPVEIQPVYVRDDIGWTKLPEQGKRT